MPRLTAWRAPIPAEPVLLPPKNVEHHDAGNKMMGHLGEQTRVYVQYFTHLKMGTH
jgi:hypothetical protein